MASSYLGTAQDPLVPVSDSDRILAILAHLLTLFASFFAPLIIYLIKKDESAFVRDHARESLNFQITLAILYLVAFILVFVLVGILALAVLGILHLVLVIVATVRAADNKLYRYPFSIRLIR